MPETEPAAHGHVSSSVSPPLAADPAPAAVPCAAAASGAARRAAAAAATPAHAEPA